MSLSCTETSQAVPGPYDALNAQPLNIPMRAAAILCGVSLATIRKLVADGELQSAMFGKRRYIPREELRRYLVAGLERRSA